MHDLKKAKQRMKLFLLRNNINYGGSDRWGPKHRRWLTELILQHPAQQIVLQECITTLNERFARLERLDNELKHQVFRWHYYQVGEALQAMRAIKLIVSGYSLNGLIGTLRAVLRTFKLAPDQFVSPTCSNLGQIYEQCKNY